MPLYPATKTVTAWINPAAFAIPASNIGRAGNSPIGTICGPGTQAVSLSLFKTLAITGRARLQVCAAAENGLNHPNYGNPNPPLGTAAFGTITATQAADGAAQRSIQVSARVMF